MNSPITAGDRSFVLDVLEEQVDRRVRSRALEYLEHVRVLEQSPRRIDASVRGVRLYEVILSHVRDMVNFTCTCDRFTGGLEPCEHVWATLIRAVETGFLARLPEECWLYLVPLPKAALHGPPGQRPPPNAKPKESAWDRDLRSWLQRLEPPSASRGLPPPPIRFSAILDLQEMRHGGGLKLSFRFEEQGAKGKWRALRTAKLTRETIIRRLPEPLRRGFSMLCGAATPSTFGWYDSHEPVPAAVQVSALAAPLVLDELCRLGCVRLRDTDGAETPLAWDGGVPWDLVLTLTPRGRHHALLPEIRRGDATLPPSDVLIASDDGMLVTRTTIGTIRLGGAGPILHVLAKEGITVETSEVPRLASRVLEFPDVPPIEAAPEILSTRTLSPVPEIHVRPAKGPYGHEAETAFDYEGRKIGFSDRGSGWVESTEGTPPRAVRRDAAAEQHARTKLADLGFKPGGLVADFTIASKRLAPALRELMAAGWRVTADGKLFRQAGAWKLEVSSGVDWFDLEGGVEFDGEVVPLPRLLAAKRKGENTVVLDDGSIGMLPEDWLRRFGGLAGLGREEGDRLRFARAQAGILDAMIAAQPDVAVDKLFARARQQLRTFERVAPAVEPDAFDGTLRPYQREGLAWLRFLEEFGFGGCLADDMGLGKTIQVLAHLAARTSAGPVMVVCPRSLVFNWKAEAARFVPTLRVLDHTGVNRIKPGAHFRDHDLVITTYGILRKDAQDLAEIRFDTVILDEAQAIKNRDTDSAKAARLLHADHRLALSGTPIENRLAELGSLFEFLNPGLLGSAAAFDGLVSAGNPDAISALAKGLRPFILRRTKEQVVEDLPPKTEQTLTCELEGRHKQLYDELRDHYRASLLGKIDADGLPRAKIQVLEALLRLRQASCHPGLIDRSRAGESSPKLDLLLERLTEVVAERHKALVFSQFTSLLSIVKRQLHARGIVYEYLDGRTRDREARVTRFRSDAKCPIFLISLKAGGLGLNLVEADYVFLLDPWWNPAVEAQAIDRTHRIGQTRSVFAYRLIAEGTVEEKVLELQRHKRALADAVIHADESLIRSLTRDDIERLLS